MAGLSLRLLFLCPLRERNEHGHTAAIVGVLAMSAHQVSFFELNRDQDVGCGCDCEHQMRRGHHRSRPEHHQPAGIKRMADKAVRAWSTEAKWSIRSADQI